MTILFGVLLIIGLSGFAPTFGVDGSGQGTSKNPRQFLNANERKWLEAHPVIRVGGPKAFPPFHYYDDHGKAIGIAPDYLALIMKTLGVQMRYEPVRPWPEVLEKIKTGRLDLIACAAKSPERESFLAFSQPYLSFPLVILTRQDESFVSGLEDLQGKRVAMVKGIITAQWLKRDGIKVVPLEVESPLQALEAVAGGRADAIIENLAAASYLINKHGFFNLKVAAPTDWGDYRLFFAVRKDWPILVSIINKAFQGISHEQKTSIHNKWITIRYEFGIPGQKIALWFTMFFIPITTFICFILFYNRRLKREIKSRVLAERELEGAIQELQTALGNIKQLKGLLPICASCKKIRDDQGYWKQVEEYLAEHSDAIFSHGLCPDCIKRLYPEVAEKILPKIEEKSRK